jgi:hypothetical protein
MSFKNKNPQAANRSKNDELQYASSIYQNAKLSQQSKFKSTNEASSFGHEVLESSLLEMLVSRQANRLNMENNQSSYLYERFNDDLVLPECSKEFNLGIEANLSDEGGWDKCRKDSQSDTSRLAPQCFGLPSPELHNELEIWPSCNEQSCGQLSRSQNKSGCILNENQVLQIFTSALSDIGPRIDALQIAKYIEFTYLSGHKPEPYIEECEIDLSDETPHQISVLFEIMIKGMENTCSQHESPLSSRKGTIINMPCILLNSSNSFRNKD